MSELTQISAFKTKKKNELYLFVAKEEEIQIALNKLPDELLVMFGEPEHIFDFDLSEKKRLPRSDSKEVIASLKKKGYYIQMPPGENTEKISDMAPPPERLDNIF